MTGIPIPNEDVEEWLQELKPYQRNALSQFLRENSEEEAAKLWLTTSGPSNIVPFGGVKDTRPFWDKFQEEFHRLLCDEKAYREEKEALLRESPITKALLISHVSAVLGASVGYAAAFVAPSVTILLYLVGRVGLNAYCASIANSIAED